MSTETDTEKQQFSSFSEFYPYYLSEHSNLTCRRLHYLGSSLVIAVILTTMLTGQLWYLLLVPLCGYGCAWIGHFYFEHNKPATFKYPLYSLLGDWVMFKDMLTGRIKF